MKKVLLITALATAFGVAYIERVPEESAPSVHVAGYQWACYPRKCHRYGQV
jgi:hypothetical protein